MGVSLDDCAAFGFMIRRYFEVVDENGARWQSARGVLPPTREWISLTLDSYSNRKNNWAEIRTMSDDKLDANSWLAAELRKNGHWFTE